MPQRNSKSIFVLLFCIVLTIAASLGCGGGTTCNEQLALQLTDDIINEGTSNVNHSLQRVDSAEQAGVFTAVRANTVKAMIYGNANQRQMAAYYAEKAFDAEKEQSVINPGDSSNCYTTRCILADVAYANGEYGKSLSLAKEVLSLVGDRASSQDVAMKCRALSQMADCESELNHIDEAEQLLLQSVDLLMESTQYTTRFSDIDPLIYTLLSLNDLYLDYKMPDRALPLMAKMDTALNRMILCPDCPDMVIQLRRNNVTISKALVYAANGQNEKAEALFCEHQQSPGLDAADQTAAGVYLTMMGRYDEAIRLFDEADSMIRSLYPEPAEWTITDFYVKNFLKHKYEALQKAGRMAEALSMSDYMRQLTDSLRQQERQADVQQLQAIKHQEEEIARKHQTLTMHRIILIGAFLLLFLLGYIIWRTHRYNRLLAEKNRSLFEQTQQREQAEAEDRASWFARDDLTAEQQLYRQLCALMTEQQPYTDENMNRDTLAQLLGTNTKYVVQAIRECSNGDTVNTFITHYRLEHVAHLLKTTDHPIAVVGELSGIPNRATLARLFRNAYGMTCKEYREAARTQSLGSFQDR